jgi:hypothetical protein
MSDVSAVVLTLGEATTEEALAGLRRQTLPLREIIVVRDVSPFHQAINTGARQVTTPFFVQIDADMILDPGGLAGLRRMVRRDTGIVVGELRDALIGQVVGVKLFRTAPFQSLLMGDTISPDTDLGRGLRRAGWQTLYAGRPPRGQPGPWATFGEHRPDYRPQYTWRKYLLEGRRYRYRDNPDGIRWHFGRLETSRHDSAVIAQIALANGIFLESERDLLGPLRPDAGYARLAEFLAQRVDSPPGQLVEETAPRRDVTDRDLSAALAESFGRYHERGRALFATRASGSFRALLDSLSGCHKNEARLVAKIGLCRGLAAPAVDSPSLDGDLRVLREFLRARPQPDPGAGLSGLAARLGIWLRRGEA